MTTKEALQEALDQIQKDLTEIIQLKEENTKLKEALDYIDDHGRALSFLETLKAQKAEIEDLKKRFVYTEIERLKAEVERLKECLRKEGSIEGYK